MSPPGDQKEPPPVAGCAVMSPVLAPAKRPARSRPAPSSGRARVHLKHLWSPGGGRRAPGCRTARRTETSPEAPILSSPAPAPLHRAPLGSLPPTGHGPLSSRRTPRLPAGGKTPSGASRPPPPRLPSDVRSYRGAALSQPPQPRAPLHSPARARAAILALTARPGPPSSAASGRQGPGLRKQKGEATPPGHAPREATPLGCPV